MQKQRPAPSPINSWPHVNMQVGEEARKCSPGPLVACVLLWAFLTFGWAAPQARVPGLLFPHPPPPPVPAGERVSCVCLCPPPTDQLTHHISSQSDTVLGV